MPMNSYSSRTRPMGAFCCAACNLSQPFFTIAEANIYAAAHTEYHEALEYVNSMAHDVALDK